MRATASTEVRARADTHMVMKTVASVWSTPNAVMPRAMPWLKIWNGVPTAAPPAPEVFIVVNMMAATTMASTPTNDSSTMAP